MQYIKYDDKQYTSLNWMNLSLATCDRVDGIGNT